jgi:hypothetical protein
MAQPSSHLPHSVPQVHPDQGRDLVVAGPAGTQPAAELGADQLYQPSLQRAVHILVSLGWLEYSGIGLGCERAQADDHRRQFVVSEQSSLMESFGMRPRPGQVVGRKPPVEVC